MQCSSYGLSGCSHRRKTEEGNQNIVQMWSCSHFILLLIIPTDGALFCIAFSSLHLYIQFPVLRLIQILFFKFFPEAYESMVQCRFNQISSHIFCFVSLCTFCCFSNLLLVAKKIVYFITLRQLNLCNVYHMLHKYKPLVTII